MLSFLVMLIGLIVYFLGGYIRVSPSEVKECGKLAYFCGLFTWLMQVGAMAVPGVELW